MTSFEKRKALVNQLRSAHFPFGFENNQGAQSEYIERYKEYEAKKQEAVGNARKNNFSVTNPDNNTNYQSQFKERYPQHPIGSRDDPSKLKQSHASKNFVFGYDPNAYETNYKDDFIKKGFDRPKPVNQKEPHIDFGGDSLTDFTTTYNQVHDKKEGSQKEVVDPQMIRRSNMILGNDKTNFNTENSATYVPKPIHNERVTQVSNFSNINLGNDGKNFSSENKANFLHKQAPAHTVDKQKVLDFRSAHFKLGFPEGHDYQSENKAQYEQKPIDFKKAQGNRQSSLNFNIDGKNYFNSSYNDDYLSKQNTKEGPLKNIGRVDNVHIGFDKSDPNSYVTEAKSQFNDKGGQFEKASKIKQKSQLQLGDAKGDYLTHNQDIYKNKFNDRQNNQLTDAQLRQLKGVHFETGFQNNGYGLSSANYGVGNGEANTLTKQKIASMKNTNVVSGTDNPFKGGTTYNGSYLWKKGQEN